MFSFFTERNPEQKLGMALLAGAFLLALFSPVHAHEFKAGDLEINHPWSRATPAGAKVGGGYMVIKNAGAAADRLVAVTSDVSDKVEIHEMSVKNDVMTMRKLDQGVEVPAKGEVALKPGSYHLMFMNIKEGFKEGESFKATLQFEKAGNVDVSFKIEPMGKQSHDDHSQHKPAADHGGHSNH